MRKTNNTYNIFLNAYFNNFYYQKCIERNTLDLKYNIFYFYLIVFKGNAIIVTTNLRATLNDHDNAIPIYIT